MRRMMMLAAALVMLAGPALAQKPGERLRSYDAQGRRTGTIERGSDGTLRSYDARGRRTGTAERGSVGAWRTYDAQGRRTGTIERR